jgi:Beta-galactosidase
VTIQFSARRIALLAALCSGVLLASCGGGGDTSAAGVSSSKVDADADTGGASGAVSGGSGGAPTADAEAATAAGRTIKWNPGHYAVVGTNAGPAMVDQLLSETGRFPWVKGLVLRTSWPELETSKGQYDFSVIDADLQKVAAAGKRVFIMVGTKSFSVDDKAVPEYLRSAEYGGGAYRIAIRRGGYGENAAIYNSKVADRLQALYQAIGNRYNRENTVEGVLFNETALGMATRPLTPAQQKAQFDNMARVNVAARSAFANTTMIQYINSPMEYVPQLWKTMQANEVGVGGPDVFLNDKTLNKLLPSYASAAGDVPIGVQVEAHSYSSSSHDGAYAPPAVSAIYAFARDRMKANYIFWTPITTEAGNPWSKVLNMWSSGSFPNNATGGLSAKCPSGASCTSSL